MIQAKAKEFQKLPEAGRRKEWIPESYQHLDFSSMKLVLSSWHLKTRENTILLFKAFFLISCSPSLEKPIQHVIKNPLHVLRKDDKVVYCGSFFSYIIQSASMLIHKEMQNYRYSLEDTHFGYTVSPFTFLSAYKMLFFSTMESE